MNLRQKIKRLIDESPSYDDASKLICVMLSDELELSGNGWFEDDPELEALLEDSDDPKAEHAYNELSDRVECILAGK
jgi:hypothetical protein